VTSIPSLHGETTIIYGGRAAVLPNIDVTGTDGLALVGVEPTREQGEDVARDGEEDVKGILGCAYARILEGRLLLVGRRHVGERGQNGDMVARREPDHIANGPGTKKVPGLRSLY
jgi:hypothetical protein